MLDYRVSYDHDKNVRSTQSNEMIKIQEIIIFPSVTQKNVDTELGKCGIMAWHDIREIRPMRYELSKCMESNKFHAPKMERV